MFNYSPPPHERRQILNNLVELSAGKMIYVYKPTVHSLVKPSRSFLNTD